VAAPEALVAAEHVGFPVVSSLKVSRWPEIGSLVTVEVSFAVNRTVRVDPVPVTLTGCGVMAVPAWLTTRLWDGEVDGA
jgi:hypothetical protein